VQTYMTKLAELSGVQISASDKPEFQEVNMTKQIVLFVHGLFGKGEETWGQFPELLRSDPLLSRVWEPALFSFPTSYVRVPFWKSAPPIQLVAMGLRTELDTRYPESEVGRIVIVGHSLGGLVARRYVLDECRRSPRCRIDGLCLYGTPHNGTGLAKAASYLPLPHQQLRQLAIGSEFLDDLNTGWQDLSLNDRIPTICVVGDSDDVVLPHSAQGFWGSNNVRVITNATHTDLVKPKDRTDLRYLVLQRFLLKEVMDSSQGTPGNVINGGDQGSPISPSQSLPRRPGPDPKFKGREQEIADLIATLREATGGHQYAVVGIWGMGGIGKTELAYAVAQAVQDDFPDRQLVLRLQDVGNERVTPEAALQRVIRALEPATGELPRDRSSLEGHYHRLLHGKRVLVLADDAQDAEQVKALVPTPGSALIVTSRTRLVLSSATRTLSLGTLPAPDAEALLLAICPRIGPTAPELARHCGYLPLALSIAAGLLAETHALSPSDYLGELKDEALRLRALRVPEAPQLDVQATLNASYEKLPTAVRKALSQCSVFPAPFDRTTANRVLKLEDGSSSREVLETLGRLERHSLLNFDPGTERYSLHDLVRLSAATYLEPAEEREARVRHANYCRQVIERAAKGFIGDKMIKWLLWLTMGDWEVHIQAAWQWLQRVGPTTEETDRLLIQYAVKTEEIGLWILPSGIEHIPLRLASHAAALRLGLDAARTKTRLEMDMPVSDPNQQIPLIPFYEEWRDKAAKSGDRRGQSLSLWALGNEYREAKKLDEAIRCYEEWVGIAQEVGDRRDEWLALYHLGEVRLEKGEPGGAIEYCKSWRNIAQEIRNRSSEGGALASLAIAYQELEQWDQAIEYGRLAREIMKEIGDRQGEASVLHVLGNTHCHVGKLQLAIEYYQEMLEIARAIQNRQNEHKALKSLGDAHRQSGELDEALSCYEQALPIVLADDDWLQRLTLLSKLQKIHEELGNSERAEEYGKQRARLWSDRGGIRLRRDS
jgi:tetratricopeptide (TPR) repeat protein/pimeloyl-ACP methyl ester carboxylesterase